MEEKLFRKLPITGTIQIIPEKLHLMRKKLRDFFTYIQEIEKKFF